MAASEDEDLGSELTMDSEGMGRTLEAMPLREEGNAIRALLEQARPLVGQDSKRDALRRALDELQAEGYRQVIIFSQYTDTVKASFLAGEECGNASPGKTRKNASAMGLPGSFSAPMPPPKDSTSSSAVP